MKYGQLADISQVNFDLPLDHHLLSKFNPISNSKLELHIGSSVWADKNFVGNLYPQKTPQKKFLETYARIYSTTEVNSTRYGTPKRSTLENWKNSVPDHFRFCFKMPQIITQRTNLLDSKVLERLDEFVIAMDFMEKKAGRTFMLLQNNFNLSRLEELNSFLGRLPKEQKFAIELRNPEVNHHAEFLEVLSKNNIGHVITDTAGDRDIIHMCPTNNSTFIRFVGNAGDESDQIRIGQWVNRLQTWEEKGIKEIYFLIHQPSTHRHISPQTIDFFQKKWSE